VAFPGVLPLLWPFYQIKEKSEKYGSKQNSGNFTPGQNSDALVEHSSGPPGEVPAAPLPADNVACPI
jgi:hypothetical protein